LSQAKDDLLVYFSAGTRNHALVSLQTQTAANSASCKTATNNAKVQVAQGATPTTANTATGCGAVSQAAKTPVGLTKGAIDKSVKAPADGKTAPVSLAITAISDDAVTISLSPLTAAQIVSVQVNGGAAKKETAATLTAADAKGGKATIIFNITGVKPQTTFSVVASGKKGAEQTGPDTLGSVVVTP
jgi:hypothetical protein